MCSGAVQKVSRAWERVKPQTTASPASTRSVGLCCLSPDWWCRTSGKTWCSWSVTHWFHWFHWFHWWRCQFWLVCLSVIRCYERRVQTNSTSSWSSSSPSVSASSASLWRWLPWRPVSGRRPPLPKPNRKKKSSVRSWRHWGGVKRKSRWIHLHLHDCTFSSLYKYFYIHFIFNAFNI